MELSEIVVLFSKTSTSKEEAFLKGFLMGLGTHSACPTPNWEVIEEYPCSIATERQMREIFEEVHKGDIEKAKRLLAQYQEVSHGGQTKEEKDKGNNP